MKALSLTQPWASLVAARVKKWETRSWSTKYRGPLAIHAAKGYPRDAQQFAFELFFHGLRDRRDEINTDHPLLMRGFPEAILAAQNLPRGMILCTCTLMDCQPVEKVKPSRLEAHLGDYSPGRFAWMFADVHLLQPYIPARGALGLWNWTRPS